MPPIYADAVYLIKAASQGKTESASTRPCREALHSAVPSITHVEAALCINANAYRLIKLMWRVTLIPGPTACKHPWVGSINIVRHHSVVAHVANNDCVIVNETDIRREVEFVKLNSTGPATRH